MHPKLIGISNYNREKHSRLAVTPKSPPQEDVTSEYRQHALMTADGSINYNYQKGTRESSQQPEQEFSNLDRVNNEYYQMDLKSKV